MKKNLLTTILLFLMVTGMLSLFVKDVVAEGSIISSSGNAYTTIAEAFNSVQDGDDVTFTITGEVQSNNGNDYAGLTKNAKVTLIAGDATATIKGSLGNDGGGELVVGSGNSNSLSIIGTLKTTNGILEINSEVTVDIVPHASATNCVLAQAASGKTATVRIDGAHFNASDSDNAIYIFKNNAILEYIRNAEINLNNSTAKGILIEQFGKAGSIKDCKIYGGLTGIEIKYGGSIEEIVGSSKDDCQISGYNYAIVVSGPHVNSSETTEIGKISNVTASMEEIAGRRHDNALSTIYIGGRETGKVHIGSIENCQINCLGLYPDSNAAIKIGSQGNVDNFVVDTIKGNIINCTGNSMGIELSNYTIGTIEDNEIQTKNGHGIFTNKINCDLMKNNKVVANGDGRYGVQLGDPTGVGYIKAVEGFNVKAPLMGLIVATKVDTIKNSQFEATLTNSTGIRVAYLAKVASIEAVTSYGKNCSIEFMSGRVDEIKDCKLNSEENPSKYGIYVMKWYDTEAYVGTIENCDIYATENGIRNAETIDKIIGGTIISDGSAIFNSKQINEICVNKAVSKNKSAIENIYNRAVVTAVTGGTYIGKTDAVLVNESKLNNISGNPVFYGETGYAINNKTAAGTTNLELDIPNKGQGDGRYYGKSGIIFDTSKIVYPIYGPTNSNYFMSTLTEKVNDIDGIDFHYLTTNLTLRYDGNGGRGDISAVTVEYNKEVDVLNNVFVNGDKTFMYWNTKADRSGKTYQEGSKIKVTEDTTLYAIWPNTYTLRYKLDGGTYNGSSEDIVEMYEEETEVKVHQAPSKEGYKFLYWEGSKYYPGDNLVMKQDHTLTARWEKVEVAPKTGDNNHLYTYMTLLGCSMVMINVLKKKLKTNLH